MMPEKKTKQKITRRKAGLVITPPPPRPVQADHPASFIFREAVEAERAAAGKIQDGVEEKPGSSPGPELVSTPQEPTFPREVLRRSHEESVKVSARRPQVAVLPLASDKPTAPESVKHVETTRSENDTPPTGNLTWEEFERTFKKRLSKSQLRVCQVLFEATYAQGVETCLMRTQDLMQKSQVMGRTMYYALSELESAGFILRGPIYNTPTKRGQLISFYPTPRIKRLEVEAARQFHYHDESD